MAASRSPGLPSGRPSNSATWSEPMTQASGFRHGDRRRPWRAPDVRPGPAGASPGSGRLIGLRTRRVERQAAAGPATRGGSARSRPGSGAAGSTAMRSGQRSAGALDALASCGLDPAAGSVDRASHLGQLRQRWRRGRGRAATGAGAASRAWPRRPGPRPGSPAIGLDFGAGGAAGAPPGRRRRPVPRGRRARGAGRPAPSRARVSGNGHDGEEQVVSRVTVPIARHRTWQSGQSPSLNNSASPEPQIPAQTGV